MQRIVELFPVKCAVRFEQFKLADAIVEDLRSNNITLQDKDILIVSSKFAAVSQGRFVELSKIPLTREAEKLAKTYCMKPELAQLVLNESDVVIGGIRGFLLALIEGVLAPNAGIDQSNAPNGWAILYPEKPQFTARKLKRDLLRIFNKEKTSIRKLGVILSDSRVTPTRLGTIGVAVGVAGIRPTIDMRGKEDLFRNRLKVTLRALADQIATAGEIAMGEASESTPVVLVRGVESAFERPKNEFERTMTISLEKCLIVSGLKNAYKK